MANFLADEPAPTFGLPRFLQPAGLMRASFASDPKGLDIALIGVPYDLGSSNRAGPRHGPAQVREMSRLIKGENGSTGVAPFDLCKIADLGDTPMNPFDNMESLKGIETFFSEVHRAGAVTLAIGGDHTIPISILRAIASKERPVGCVHFDAHEDVGDVAFGSRFFNGSPFRRAIEDGLVDPKRFIQIGIRGTRKPGSSKAEDWGAVQGVRTITMDEYEEIGRARVIQEIHRVVGTGPVYVTFDIDALDSAHCPGTGAPEPGGLSMRDSQVMLRSLRDLDVIGGDVCEVAPPLDPGGQTAWNAATLAFEILCVLAESVVRRKRP